MKDLFELDALTGAPVIEVRENLMLVDCLNLAFRFKHRGLTDFAAEFTRTISSLAKSYSALQVILLSDKGSSSFRKSVFAEYKGNREEKYKDQTEEEKAEFMAFMEGFEKALDLASELYPLIRFTKVEADDLAAYIVKHHSYKFKNVWLISSDADWDLLLKHNVHRFSFYSRKEYRLDNFFENNGCDNPDQFVSIKVLMGDKGDNIPGCDLVGVKRAYAFLREYGSAMDLYDALPLTDKKAVSKNINNFGDQILINYELVDLLSYCETAIAYPDPTNLEKLEELCNEYCGED